MSRGRHLIKQRDGQQVMEYLLMATAVVVVIILMLYPSKSPMQSAVNDVLNLPTELIKGKNAQIKFAP
jgi:uncharacterized protein (UPF0333 family)